jgi:pimeloyl-[acyl-carrier protein] methyl ester esterase
MHIETLGHGPDLVLLHGWAMHSGIFAPLTRELAPRFRLHLVDLPGHGYSSERDLPFDLADCARRVAAATPPALWLGWSLGGLVCLEAALQRQAQLRALCLIATNPRFVEAADWPHGVAPTVFGEFAQGLRTDYRRTVERFLALEAMGSDHAQSELRELKAQVFDRGEPAVHVLCDGLAILDRADLRTQLPQLGVPSLWIAGQRDRLVPHGAMAWAAQQAPQARYLELAAGHAPFLGHAAEIADAIAAFHAQVIGNETVPA